MRDGALAMGRLCSTRLTFTALSLAAVMHATNPALAQNINDLLTIFGGDRQRALRHAALAEWRRLPPAEIACIDQGLRQKGSSADALVRKVLEVGTNCSCHWFLGIADKKYAKSMGMQKAEAYFEHALTVAGAQQAKYWELRAAMSMPVSGANRASGMRLASFSLRSTAGSQRGSTRGI
jgi:hypothetical protein